MKIQNVHGDYCDAVIYTADDPRIAIDNYALAQIQMICNHRAARDSVIRVMPDVHPGKVGPIGLTMTFRNCVLPQLVGIDIGCGMTMVKLQAIKPEYQKLDSVIRAHVPTGYHIHKTPVTDFDFEQMICSSHIQTNKALCSLGTLGGGNHFIEIDRDESGEIYIIIHSGSRHLGKEVAEFYCREGMKTLRNQGISEPFETTWLEGELMHNYLHDAAITQKFAQINRETILKIILKKMKWKPADDIISCCHNYIESYHTSDAEQDSSPVCILRKGAISAKQSEPVIIPVHMKDGVILGTGKGNAEWNMSAPHGSGRLYKREEVQNLFSVSSYKKSVEGIYSSCINRSTLDESPFCYRNLSDIQDAICETVQIEHLLKSLYNYKDNSERRNADTD